MFSFLNKDRSARPPKIIVHIGMHKTGTSSIQDTFYHSADPAIAYIDWISGNHSPLFVLLFENEEKQGQYHLFKNRGEAFLKRLPALKELWMNRLAEQVKQAGDKTVIFSAEDCSAPKFETATKQMHRFFSNLSPDVSAIGYARHPKSFVQSAFQQNLRGGTVIDMERKGLRPNYRKRFEKMDRFFGAENVTLREFHKTRLLENDVVKDFASCVGISAPPQDKIIRSNDSMSLESTALLYVQRRLGKGRISGFPAAEEANNWFITKLSGLGQGKLVFADEMLAPLMGRIAEDVGWMEDRLGQSFVDEDQSDGPTIEKMDQLTEIAMNWYDQFVEMAGITNAGPATLENLVRNLDRFMDHCYSERLESLDR